MCALTCACVLKGFCLDLHGDKTVYMVFQNAENCFLHCFIYCVCHCLDCVFDCFVTCTICCMVCICTGGLICCMLYIHVYLCALCLCIVSFFACFISFGILCMVMNIVRMDMICACVRMGFFAFYKVCFIHEWIIV